MKLIFLAIIVIHFKAKHIYTRFRVENPQYILGDLQRLRVIHNVDSFII